MHCIVRVGVEAKRGATIRVLARSIIERGAWSVERGTWSVECWVRWVAGVVRVNEPISSAPIRTARTVVLLRSAS